MHSIVNVCTIKDIMNDQLKICRLCFKLISKNDCKSVENELVMVTAIFLDLVNWECSENPLLCYECAENLQKSYDFKSACLMSEEQIYIASGCKQDDVDLWQIKNESESKTFRENKKICRFYLSLNENGKYFQLEEKHGIHLMLQQCLPELNLLLVREPVICQNCFSALESLFNFEMSCLSIEESINMYRDAEGTDSNDKVNLYNVLQFTKIKKKSDVDDTHIEEFMNENKIETIVKLEHQQQDESFEEEPEVFLKPASLKFEEESETSVKIEHTENQTDTEESRRPKDGVILPQPELTTNLHAKLKCLIANHKEDLSKPCVKQTMVNENIPTVLTYRCEICSFWTLNEDNLQMHLQQHADPSQIMFKCDSYSYRTKTVGGVKIHLLKYTDPSELTVFKCNSGSFETKYKRCLTNHSRKHTNPSKVTMFKCDSCSYQTKYERCLTNHSRKHTDDSKVTMFKCDSCSYQAKYESTLKRHLVLHKNPSEVIMFECDTCSFQTKYENSLQLHSLMHKDPRVTMFKCVSCSFHTKRRGSFKEHLLRRRH